MKRVLVVRHGQTAWNEDGLQTSYSDIPLDETGQRQAHSLGRALAAEPIEHIFTSPLMRAYSTAAAISGYHDAPLVRDGRLRELDFGPFEGRHITAEMDGTLADAYRAWIDQDQVPSIPPGAESYESGARRIEAAFAALPEGLTVLVTHGVIARILLTHSILELPPSSCHRLWLDHAAVSEITEHNGFRRLIRINARLAGSALSSAR